MWTKDATCSVWIQRPKRHKLKWQEDRLRLQMRKDFLLEQLGRNQLPASSPVLGAFKQRGICDSSLAGAEGV